MTGTKLVLYLEQKTFSKKFQYSYGFTHHQAPPIAVKNSTRLADYHVMNSLGHEIHSLFYKLKINPQTLIDLKQQAINKIGIIEWKVVQSHLCKAEDRSSSDLDVIRDSVNILIHQKIPLVVKIEPGFWLEDLKKKINGLSDLDVYFNQDWSYMFMKTAFRSSAFRYRLYHDQRLLIERNYPIDIQFGKILVETMQLNENARGEIRVESDFDLQIKRIDINDRTQDIYDTCFKLA